MAKRATIYLIVIIFLIIIGGLLFYFTSNRGDNSSREDPRKERLATCLSEKGVKMYGLSTCPYCLQQKEIFGSAFSKINYIECNKNGQSSKTCIEAGIGAVPTWSFPQSLNTDQKLLSCTDCIKKEGGFFCRENCYELPKEKNEFRVAGFIELEDLSKITECPF